MRNSRFYFKLTMRLLHRVFKRVSKTFEGWERAPEMIELIRSDLGYTVQVDDFTLPFDMSWGEADKLRDQLREYRRVS